MSYPIDLHTHTIASTHAYSTLTDYILMAKAKGIQLFAMTDHGPAIDDAPHSYHFSNMRVIPRLIDGIGILRGIEANILNIRGEIDCNAKMLANLDFIAAGFHFTGIGDVDALLTEKNRDYNTQALMATIANGHIHMVTHPGNPKFPIDIEAVAHCAARYEVALEINNSSFIGSRLGSKENCYQIARAVKAAGGLLALGSDSHIAYSIGDFTHCEQLLQSIEFPEERVLNRSCRTFLDFLTRRTGRVIEAFSHF